MAELSGRTRMMFQVMSVAPQWMIHAYIRLAVVRTAGKGWVEDCKKRFSPPDLRTSALNKFNLMHRDNMNAMKQNGFGMARDLQLITGNWGFELSDVPPGYHGPLHIWQGGEDWCVSPYLQQLIQKHDTDLVQPHERPGEGHLSLSATMTRDTETRFQLCSARCISRARPKPYTLNPKKRKQQESAELFDNAMKGVKFLLDLTLDGCKRHFSENSRTSTPKHLTDYVQHSELFTQISFNEFYRSSGKTLFFASQWLLKCVSFLVLFGMGYFLLKVKHLAK